MIEKRIVFKHEHDECSVEPIDPSVRSHLKLASVSNLSPEVREYVDKHILPNRDPRYLYVLVSALGAGEIWGPNSNGDFFTTKDILASHETFVTYGYAFTHHQNKDPRKAIGRILLSVWNPRMHRVELLVQIDRQKAPQIADDIESGKTWDVSMGCKVKYDVCSICKNKAYTRAEYCDHLKNHMGKVLPDGRQVYAINPNPRFFDISFVWIGADPTAKTLLKVASKNKEASLQKKSSIIKEIPGGTVLSTDAGEIASKLMRNFDAIKTRENPIPHETMESLCRFHPGDVLSTLLTLGIVLKPSEFYHLYERTHPSEDELMGGFDRRIVKIVIPIMKDRSAHKPFLYPRIIKLAAEEEKPKRKLPNLARNLTLALVAATLYKRYLDQIPAFGAEGFDAVVKKNPWLIPVLTAGAVGLASVKEQSTMQKTAGNLGGRLLVGIPAAYLTSHIVKRLNSDSKILQFIANNPLLIALLGISATNTATDWKAIKRALDSFSGQEQKTKTVIRKLASLDLDPEAVDGELESSLAAAAGLAVLNGGN